MGIGAIISALGAFFQMIGAALGLVRDDKLRADGARKVAVDNDNAINEARQKSDAIDDRPKPSTLRDTLDRL